MTKVALLPVEQTCLNSAGFTLGSFATGATISACFSLDTGRIFAHDATSMSCVKTSQNPASLLASAGAAESNVVPTGKSDVACHTAAKFHGEGFMNDIDQLSKMQLRRKYKAEATAHRDMKSRAKLRGNTVHPSFHKFRDFLTIVGPIPARGATLDRIDNDDPEYAPGKVRWADRRTQNTNKRDSLTFHDPRTGKVFIATQLAKLQGVSAAAIRKRLERGWTDTEIIAGARQLLPPEPKATRSKPFVAAPKRERSIDTMFERMAVSYKYYREEYGEEALPASFSDMQEIIGVDMVLHCGVTEESWLARFRTIWPLHKPHVIFANASVDHQRLIEIIDPEYVAQERQKMKKAKEIASQL